MTALWSSHLGAMRLLLAALQEGFQRGAQKTVSVPDRRIETDFAAYVAAITGQTGRIRLPTGDIVPKVPFSVFWLVEDDEFIGEANIRHQLNAYLIKEGEARRLPSVPRASARAMAS